MSFVSATPDSVAAAAGDLARIGSTISSANSAALGPTSGVLAPGADEVSASIASLFDAHSQVYQTLSAQATAFHSQFVQLMNGGASQYALTEAANASPLQTAAGPASAAAQVPGISAGLSSAAPAAPAAAPLGAAVAPAAVAPAAVASPAQAATSVAAAPAGSATLASANTPLAATRVATPGYAPASSLVSAQPTTSMPTPTGTPATLMQAETAQASPASTMPVTPRTAIPQPPPTQPASASPSGDATTVSSLRRVPVVPTETV